MSSEAKYEFNAELENNPGDNSRDELFRVSPSPDSRVAVVVYDEDRDVPDDEVAMTGVTRREQYYLVRALYGLDLTQRGVEEVLDQAEGIGKVGQERVSQLSRAQRFSDVYTE